MRTSPLAQPDNAVPPDVAALLLAVPPHPAMTAAARAVTPARLVATAQRLVAEAEHWRHRVGFAIEDRTAVLVERTTDYEAWALGWLPGQDTGVHDHAASTAALCVTEGRLRLRSTAVGGGERVHALAPGTVRVIGSTDVHRLWNAGGEPAVSVHVYAPRRSMQAR